MADKHLRGQSKKIRKQKNAWWYETPKGVEVIVQHYDGDRYLGTSQYMIPWRQVRVALERKDR